MTKPRIRPLSIRSVCITTAIVAAGFGCTATSPSAEGTLAIRASTSTMRVGDQQTLNATAASAVSARVVTPIWTSSDDAIATIDSHGLVKAQRNGSATITASWSRQTADYLLRIVSNVQGTWLGQFVVTECNSSGVGFPCRGVPGYTNALTLRFEQTADQLSGILQMSLYSGDFLSGIVSGDGQITLSGMARDSDGGTFELQEWRSQISREANTMAGRFRIRHEFVTFFGPQFIVYSLDFSAVLQRPHEIVTSSPATIETAAVEEE